MKKKTVVLILVGILSLFGVLSLLPSWPKIDDKKAKAIAGWLRAKNLSPGRHPTVKLPPQFATLDVRGAIDVMVQKNGKLAFFVKSTNGFKGNYDGYICFEPGFKAILHKNPSGYGDTIDIFGDYGFYTLIRKKHSTNLYSVYSDLG